MWEDECCISLEDVLKGSLIVRYNSSETDSQHF